MDRPNVVGEGRGALCAPSHPQARAGDPGGTGVGVWVDMAANSRASRALVWCVCFPSSGFPRVVVLDVWRLGGGVRGWEGRHSRRSRCRRRGRGNRDHRVEGTVTNIIYRPRSTPVTYRSPPTLLSPDTGEYYARRRATTHARRLFHLLFDKIVRWL